MTPPLSIRRVRPWLGTLVEIALPAGWEPALERAFDRVAHIHARMSYHDDGSDLAALRRAEAGAVVRVDSETITVLRTALQLHADTAGLFDVTVGRRLTASGFLPRHAENNLRRIIGDTNDIEIIDDTHIRCARPVLIDLGGIAKGYAVDRAVAELVEAGCPSGIVNAGGDLRVFGEGPQRVSLRSASGQISRPLSISNMAVATSANADNRRWVRGRAVSQHIGRQGQSILADEAVTIVASTCMVADAMTKVAMADPDLATGLLRGHRGFVVVPERLRAA
jgi:FAD:protein FMN transferase